MPVDDAFWQQESEELMKVMQPWIEEAALRSIPDGLDALGNAIVGVSVDWNLINQQARAWAVVHTAESVAQITRTSMEAFTAAFPEWVASGQHLDALSDALAKSYEPWRARLIAVTETTRAYAEGNYIMWRASGVVDGTRWFTAEDELVCPICGGLAGETVALDQTYSTGTRRPPAHAGCRCTEHPVVGGIEPERVDLSRSAFTDGRDLSSYQLMADTASRLAQAWKPSEIGLSDLMKEQGFTGSPEAFIESMLRHWAGSSGSVPSRIMIEAAAEKAGVAIPQDFISAGVRRWFEAHPEALQDLRALGNLMFDSTQKWFRERNLEMVHLVRSEVIGTSRNRAFTSWTTSRGFFISSDINREYVDAFIPVNRIFSIPSTGFGNLDELEAVVLGDYSEFIIVGGTV